MEEKKIDYSTYPEGFKKMAEELKMRVDAPAAKENVLKLLVKQLINN